MDPPQVASEYDIVFCGGGAAACITAGRLAAANSDLRILILEAGPHTHEGESHIIPGQFFVHLAPTSKVTSFYAATAPNDHLNGRTAVALTGRCVGGGSSINWMIYTRASGSDYDDWERLGNPGWGSQDVLPLLNMVETYQIQAKSPVHGYNGPMRVSYGTGLSNIGHEFLKMTAAYYKERKTDELADIQTLGADGVNVYARWPKWIDSSTGRRSMPSSFLYSQSSNPNLVIAAGCKVNRVIVENGRAVGVEFVYDQVTHPNADRTLQCVRADRLVVLSAGALGSPTILERSGIGAKDFLEAKDIPCIVDLPGVGESYQDHQLLRMYFHASEEAETWDGAISGKAEVWDEYLERWRKNATGPFAGNFVDAGIKYRPSADEVREIGPDFEPVWKEYFELAPDKPVVCFFAANGALLENSSELPESKYFGVGACTTYPTSTGHVHIKSKDLDDPIDFDPALAKTPADTALLHWGYKKIREFARRHPFYRDELHLTHPTFSETSDGFSCKNARPVSPDAPDIKWTDEDDEIIRNHIRNEAATTWHCLGTCAMKPREQAGVVDLALNVYGVQRLKVADMSIAPANVAANTVSSAMMIGEKAAIIISKELSLQL